MRIGQKNFEIGSRTFLMGILNVTPDSFSDGGKYTSVESAVNHARQMINEGADIIDVGGESTRPGHEQISIEEEIRRVVPVITALKEHFPHIPISIDTYKPEVCEAAILAGADMINDIWGFRYDKRMAVLAAKYDLPCCLMHNRNHTRYTNLIAEIIQDLEQSLLIALSHGVKPSQIILDPGIGFGKTYEQNLEVMNHLDEIKEAFYQYPLLLAASRKSMIGKSLNIAEPEKRIYGTLATTVIGIMKNCDFIRVHDIKENKDACIMADIIIRKVRREPIG
jgi:dihydropteroate synthase